MTTVGTANIACQDSPSASGPAISVPSMPPPRNSPKIQPIATWEWPGKYLRARMNDTGITPIITPSRI
jgi:hypothetical protein